MRSFPGVLLLLAACLSAGCSLRSGSSAGDAGASASATSAQTPATLFTEQVAAMPTGASQYFPDSPFGDVLVQTGPFYYSALGRECRSVVLTSGTMGTRYALCREKTAPWGFVPTVYDGLSQ